MEPSVDTTTQVKKNLIEKNNKKEKTKDRKRKHDEIMKTVNKDACSLRSFGGIKKPYRHKPGTVAMREIKSLQGGKNALVSLVPKLSMERAIRDILSEYGLNNNMRLSASGLASLHEAAENVVTDLMDESGDNAVHAKRVTIMPKDLEKAKYKVLPHIFYKS